MLIFTIKLPPRRLRRFLAGLFLAALLIAALFTRLHTAEESAMAATDLEVQLCLECLQGFGWEVTAAPTASEVFALSGDLSPSYLAIQQEAGFDLSDDMGWMVTRYTFQVLNYPTGESGILADVLVRDGAVVGGDIRTSDLDGFMHSLVMPAG